MMVNGMSVGVRVLRATGLINVATKVMNKVFLHKRKKAAARGSNPLDAVYTQEFYAHTEKLSAESTKHVYDIIMTLSKPKSVLDIGCGTGMYLKPFENNNILVLGVDGSANAKRHSVINPQQLLIHDITTPLVLNKKYDAVICFEVAEHIPTTASAMLVTTLTKHAGTIFFTAAPPGQGGHEHINEQPFSFWEDLFAKEGYAVNTQLTEYARKELKRNNVVWWLSQGITVLEPTTFKSSNKTKKGMFMDVKRPFKLFCAGRLAPEKNVQTLIRAVALCPPWYYLRIAGDGEAKARCERIVQDLDIQDQVTFLGHIPQDDVYKEIASCDVICTPSIILEALSRASSDGAQYGKPVIVSDHCGRIGFECVVPATNHHAWAKVFTLLNEEVNWWPERSRIDAVEKTVYKETWWNNVLHGQTFTLGPERKKPQEARATSSSLKDTKNI
jgi:glycosyltransferase involved in cell wall biosynthesis